MSVKSNEKGFSGQHDGVGQGDAVGGKKKDQHPFQKISQDIEDQRGGDIKRVRPNSDSGINYQNEIPDNQPMGADLDTGLSPKIKK